MKLPRLIDSRTQEMGLRRQGLEDQFCRDCDRRLQRAVDRTSVSEKTVGAARFISLRLLGLQFEDDVDPADHEDVILQLNFADSFRHQSLIRSINLTRLQRASEGSGQSTRRGRDNIIQGSRMRFQNRGRNLVVLRHSPVYSEYDRLLFRWKIRSSHRALHALDAHKGPVNHIGHYGRIVSQGRRIVGVGKPRQRWPGTIGPLIMCRPTSASHTGHGTESGFKTRRLN
jgi:hypothetical protein